jgi:cysteine-rich repeat protein
MEHSEPRFGTVVFGALLAAAALSAGCGWLIGNDKGDLGLGDVSVDNTDLTDDVDGVDPTDTDIPVDEVTDLPTQCDSDEECDNGNPCDGIERCVDRTCEPGTPLADGEGCTIFVVVFGFCQDGICIPLTCGDAKTDPGEECDDGNDDEDDGCRSNCYFSCHWNSECDDGEICTSDLCETVGDTRLCVSYPNHDPCDDDNPCTLHDRCGDDGTCSVGIANLCDDGNQCTTDTCDPDTGCANENVEDDTECNADNHPGTTPDVCIGGVCQAGPNTWDCTTTPCANHDDANPCNGTYVCVEGTCDREIHWECDTTEDTLCNRNRCLPDTETAEDDYTCEMQDDPDGTACDDSSLCTTGEVCLGGVCEPAEELDCDDHNPCTEDPCNPLTMCGHEYTTEDCSDGLFCTVRDQCDGSGNCVGEARPCFDNEECTIDFCDEGTDACVFIPLPELTPCGDEGANYCCREGTCLPCS